MSRIYFQINSIFLLHHHPPYITSIKGEVLRRIWIKTVKSINIPEFQTIVQKSILRNGATLDAINSAVKEFQENVAVKKPQENESLLDKMGKDGIELYNNTAVK